MNDGYRKALDMEGRREWSRRKSAQGSFEWNMARLGGWQENSDSPDVMDVYSDHGDGVERLVAMVDDDERECERRITAALSLLSASDRRFAEEILRGKSWRDLGFNSRQAFYQRLDRLVQKVRENGGFGKL